jgi:hypothetical protein
VGLSARALVRFPRACVRWSKGRLIAFSQSRNVDDASRECLAIEVDHGLSGLRVTRVLEHLALSRALARRIVVALEPRYGSRRPDWMRCRAATTS